MKAMESVFAFLLAAAMLATLGVVVIGIVSFAVHGNFYRRNSNRLMRLRVLFQAIALVFFGVLMYAFVG